MTANDIHGIEHGWTVKTADGHAIGSVEETTDTYILVKSGLINVDRRYLPAGALEHVRGELKQVEVSLSREEIDAGDWSEPPAEGPRLVGAPLNPELEMQDQPHAETAKRSIHQPPAE